MSATTIDRTRTSDGFLRLAVRADAIISGLTGVIAIPLAGWLADISGTTPAFEYAIGASFVAIGAVFFWLSLRPSVRTAGIVLAVGNVAFTVATVVVVLTDVLPLTATGVALFLGTGVYTLVMAELQYLGLRRMKA